MRTVTINITDCHECPHCQPEPNSGYMFCELASQDRRGTYGIPNWCPLDSSTPSKR